jgi:putative copper export protein
VAMSDHLSVRVTNDLVHDVTAGVVPGAVLALWFVRAAAKAALAPADVSTLVQGWSWIVLLMFVAVVIFVVTGSIRLVYRTRNLRDDALPAQGRSALIKHAVFVAIFVVAVVEAFVLLQP